jgi:hypothetical protein
VSARSTRAEPPPTAIHERSIELWRKRSGPVILSLNGSGPRLWPETGPESRQLRRQAGTLLPVGGLIRPPVAPLAAVNVLTPVLYREPGRAPSAILLRLRHDPHALRPQPPI